MLMDITGNRVFRNARTHHFANRRGGGRESGDAAKKRQRKQNRSQPPAISMYAHSFAPLSVKSVPRPRAAEYGCVYKHGYSIKHFLSKVKICRRRETVLPKRIFQKRGLPISFSNCGISTGPSSPAALPACS